MKIEQMFHRPEHFTPPTNSQSPAEKASRKWDAREGEIIEQNYNLRRLLLGLVVVIVALAGALCYKAVTENGRGSQRRNSELYGELYAKR